MRFNKRTIDEIAEAVTALDVETRVPDPSTVVYTFSTDPYVIDEDTLEVAKDPPVKPPKFIATDRDGRADIPPELLVDYGKLTAREKMLFEGGIILVALEDVETLRQRLVAALEVLEDETSVAIDEADYVRYAAGRCRNDVPAGDEGLRKYFDSDINGDHIERVWTLAVEEKS